MRLKDAVRAARTAVRKTPRTGGAFAVGRQGVDVALPDGPRLHVEVFYPAPSDARGEAVLQFTEPLRQAMHTHMRVPLAALPARAVTKGLRGVPVAPGPHPLLLFMHGFGSFALQNRRQLEDLARHGYISAAVSVPGDSLVTEYGDGTFVELDVTSPAVEAQRALDKESGGLVMAEIATLLDGIRAARGSEAALEAFAGLADHRFFSLYTPPATRMRDALLGLIEVLPSMDEPPLEQVRWDRVGLFGHSLGGCASVAAAQRLARDGRPVQAVLDFDGAAFLNDGTLDLPTPAAMFHAHASAMLGVQASNARVNSAWLLSGRGVSVECAKAAHVSFTDLTFNSAAQLMGALGDTDGPAFGLWTHRATRSFFGAHLMDQPVDWPAHPGVEVVRAG